jgi:glycerol-3-phosphate acyltransferase PlsX
MKISVDAMGGDHAPAAIIEGAIRAAKAFSHEIILVGNPEVIQAELTRLGAANLPNIRIEASQDVVGMDESPAQACRQKPESSMMVAARLVGRGQADAVVSAGNSGATMAAALWHMHRLPGVMRPAITSIMPTLKGFCVVTDVGANVDCKPKHLLQFGVMGAQFAKHIFNRPEPRVGLLSIGEEETKGNELTLAAAPLFKQYIPGFIGNVEGRDIPKGMADVVVCDGFVGNVVLKFGEGLAEALIGLIKEQVHRHPIAKIGGLLLRGAFRDVHKKIDYAEYGGAPLLGVNGICIVCHGKSNPKAIFNAIRVAGELVQKGTNDLIRQELHRLHPPTEPTGQKPAPIAFSSTPA